MPLYEFRCTDGTTFEAAHSMAEVPDSLDCPACGAPARRLISPPRLSIAGTAAYSLIDATKRSAHSPTVVSSPGPGNSKGQGAYSHNPLHQKLPRP